MQTTLPTTTVSRSRHPIRLAAFFAAVIGIVTLIAFSQQVNIAPAAARTATDTAVTRAAANSERLLALDKELFSAVDTNSNAARNRRLLDLNNQFYPPDNSAAIAAARGRRLFDLNAQYYAAEANPATVAAQHGTRLLELNNRFYPATSGANVGGRSSANFH